MKTSTARRKLTTIRPVFLNAMVVSIDTYPGAKGKGKKRTKVTHLKGKMKGKAPTTMQLRLVAVGPPQTILMEVEMTKVMGKVILGAAI